MLKKKEKKRQNFIEKLQKFICNSDYFYWYKDNGFIINEKKENIDNIISELNDKKVFNGQDYASFKRQLNLYGIEIKDKTRNTKNKKIYVHNSIKLNNHTNFSTIKRKRKTYQFYKSNNINIISEINKLKEENKKFKEENKNLKKEIKEENEKFKNIFKKYEKLKKENINNFKKRKINNDSILKNEIFKNNKNLDSFFENNYIEGMFDNYIDYSENNYIDYSRNNFINDDFDNEFQINESHTESNIDFKKIGDMKINDPKDIDIDIDIDFIYSK